MTQDNNSISLDGRIILVTGASRGIGYAAALALAKYGAQIVATGRTQGALEDLDDEIKSFGGDCTLVPMDLKQMDGVDTLGKAIHDRWGRLDGLVANAGILGELAPIPHVTVKSFEETMAINVTANYRLIRSMDPLLQASSSARAIFISSLASQSRKAFWGPYAASKAALDAMVQVYAAEIDHTNAKANLIYPGPVRTQMRAKAMPGEDPSTLRTPQEIALQLLPYLAEDCKLNGQIINLRDSE